MWGEKLTKILIKEQNFYPTLLLDLRQTKMCEWHEPTESIYNDLKSFFASKREVVANKHKGTFLKYFYSVKRLSCPK